MAMPHFQAPHVPRGLLLASKLLWSNFYVSTIDMLALVIGPGTCFSPIKVSGRTTLFASDHVQSDS
jgi:hypothetical protein